ncbi:MAG: hypothetical protein WAL97_09440 [Halobacteriota archaeon]
MLLPRVHGSCWILAQEKIVEVSDAYYANLGVTEAVWKLKVLNFGPLLVAIELSRQPHLRNGPCALARSLLRLIAGRKCTL